MKQPKLIEVRLCFGSRNRPDAVANGIARLTRTQVIVEQAVLVSSTNAAIPSMDGYLPLRFWSKNGLRIGGATWGWQLSHDSRKRCQDAAKQPPKENHDGNQ